MEFDWTLKEHGQIKEFDWTLTEHGQIKGAWTPDKFTHENLIHYPYNMSPGRLKNIRVHPDAMAEDLRKEAEAKTSQDTEAQQAIIPAEPATNTSRACY
jgi:hypothetical protein